MRECRRGAATDPRIRPSLFLSCRVLLYLVSVLYAASTTVALATSTEQRHPYVAAVGNAINATVVCCVLVLADVRLRRGRRVGVALAIASYLLLQALIVAALGLAGTYSAIPLLKMMHILYVVAIVALFVLVVLVWVRS